MKIKVLKIIWKLNIWKLFENWSFENYLKIGVFENYLKKIGILKIIWELGFWKLDLRIGVLKINWELKFWKLNLRIGILEINFERNWSFEN